MELIEYVLFLGFSGLLLLLRLDARRFAAAEYDDEGEPGSSGSRGWLRRFTWYALAIALILIAYRLYPQPVTQLHLQMGDDRLQALLLGLALGAFGSSIVFMIALRRHGTFQLPEGRDYPGAAINAVFTTFIDEVLFRGVILGLLLAYNWPPLLAIAFESILYALVTRLGAPGRSLPMLLESLGIGVITGLLVLATGGIGAAILGHAITRFSIFLATGHSGQVRPAGWHPEDSAAYAPPPAGWEYADDGDDEAPAPFPAAPAPFPAASAFASAPARMPAATALGPTTFSSSAAPRPATFSASAPWGPSSGSFTPAPRPMAGPPPMAVPPAPMAARPFGPPPQGMPPQGMPPQGMPPQGMPPRLLAPPPPPGYQRPPAPPPLPPPGPPFLRYPGPPPAVAPPPPPMGGWPQNRR